MRATGNKAVKGFREGSLGGAGIGAGVGLILLGFALQASTNLPQTNTAGPGQIQAYRWPDPIDDDAAIDAHKTVLRAEVSIDAYTTVKFFEQPKSELIYESSTSIERNGAVVVKFNVGRMIKHQTLRLSHTALLKKGDIGMLVCEYEGGAVGAREGFAILRFSPNKLEWHVLPLTDNGKVVVYAEEPDRAQIWSALSDDAGAGAAPMYYATQDCRWQASGYACKSPRRQTGQFSPGDIDDPGIDIRP